jgi:hypothetical protein
LLCVFRLLGDSDHLWTKTEREQQKHQVRCELLLGARLLQ